MQKIVIQHLSPTELYKIVYSSLNLLILQAKREQFREEDVFLPSSFYWTIKCFFFIIDRTT